ncbi:MAG: methionine--tRNA ligase [Patescibacteria group bacterium]
MKDKVFITTAIDYTNDVIHIGHAYQKILADCLARFYRARLGDRNVLFTTGTDEYGTTTEKAAKARGMDMKAHVDEVSAKDIAQLNSLNISYDRFIRTTDLDHEKTASDFFVKAYQNGDVYQEKYQGLYCEGCEAYKTLSELNEDGQCPSHKTRQIQKLEEENYFFRWSKYTNFLKGLISTDTLRVTPEGKKKEMLGFIEQGILDIPITRPKYKVSWGIECPIDSEQVIYVWFDALINYYTEGLPKGFWNEETKIIHILGKDNARWHVLLWPAMLKSVGIAKLPDQVLVHSFLSLEGEKISKSRGNVILPSDLVSKYGVDPVRYYMLRHGPLIDDADISIKALEEIYNADLANGLGNLVARVAKLCDKWKLSISESEDVNWNDEWAKPVEEFRVDLVLQNIWEQIKSVDKHINENEPWRITEEKKTRDVLTWEAGQILEIGKKLAPFMPSTSQKIVDQFLAKPIKSQTPLFPRL